MFKDCGSYLIKCIQCNETILNGCNNGTNGNNESFPLEYDQSVVDTCFRINGEIKDKIDECNDLDERKNNF